MSIYLHTNVCICMCLYNFILRCVYVCVGGYNMCVEDINMYAKEHQAINLLPAPAAAAGTMILYIFTLRRVYVCVGGYNTCAQDMCMCA